jgi:hypothetical protein
MKDKDGKPLYKRKGNDIVPSDEGYVYPGFGKDNGIDRHYSENKLEHQKMKRS